MHNSLPTDELFLPLLRWSGDPSTLVKKSQGHGIPGVDSYNGPLACPACLSDNGYRMSVCSFTPTQPRTASHPAHYLASTVLRARVVLGVTEIKSPSVRGEIVRNLAVPQV
ncbi:hypothetical protein J6590_054575 [Homalodisca vitripennis]|nr:hypothetical protein J6590_054575 [Homalodisca vitripennis]